MKLGDALFKLFSDLGVKPDDPKFKAFIADPELSKVELTAENAIDKFGEVFLTFNQAKENLHIDEHFDKKYSGQAFGRFVTNSELIIKNWANEHNISPDEVKEILKTETDHKQKWYKVLNLVKDKLSTASGTNDEKLNQAYKEVNDLKGKLSTVETEIKSKYETEVNSLKEKMLLKEFIAAADSAYKFNTKLPGLPIIKETKIKNILQRYTIKPNENGAFEFFTKEDPNRRATNSKGKPIELVEAITEEFGEEFLDKGTSTPEKKPIITDGNGNEKKISPELQAKIDANKSRLPSEMTR